MTADFTVEAYDLEEVARLRNAWQDLVDRCLEPNVFAEPAFLLAAARHLAKGPAPTFLTVWRRGETPARLVGLCPIAQQRWPGPFPARVWSHPQATAALPLLDRNDAAAAMAALLNAIGQSRRRSAGLLMTGMICDGATADVVRDASAAHVWYDHRTRAVLLRSGQIAGLRGGGRKELRRQWKRLAERGALSFASAREPGAVTSALDRCLDLESKGWKGRRGTALGSTPGTRAFAQAAVGELAAAGRCRIDSLNLDGRPLAMGIILSSGDRAYFWKTAYDEDVSRSSPGLQLASHITELQRADRHIAATDSCAIPGHSMIDRVWPERWQVADVLVATSDVRTASFARMSAIERRSRRLRTAAKTWVQAFRPT